MVAWLTINVEAQQLAPPWSFVVVPMLTGRVARMAAIVPDTASNVRRWSFLVPCVCMHLSGQIYGTNKVVLPKVWSAGAVCDSHSTREALLLS